LKGRTRAFKISSRREALDEAVVLAAAQQEVGVVQDETLIFIAALPQALVLAAVEDGIRVVAALVIEVTAADALELTIGLFSRA
jgi:hypothetical protein